MVDVHLDLLDPTSQLVGVCLRLRPRFRQLRLQLPGWTPGSYLIRDYVRHLEALELRQGGESISLRRLGPACWQASIEPDGPDLEIRYRVLAPELTVRTCHLDQDHGFLALAAVVLETPADRLDIREGKIWDILTGEVRTDLAELGRIAYFRPDTLGSFQA